MKRREKRFRENSVILRGHKKINENAGGRQLRRYDIDWLRNFIIILLIPFHTARIFDYWEPNYVKSVELSWGLSWFIALIGYWFMPLMFWLAGSASWYALESRTGYDYFKERINRLFVPLVFGLLFIVPPQGYLSKISNPSYDQNYLEFLSAYFFDFSDLSGYFGTFTPAHLWFILYLLIFSLGGLPLLLKLKKESGRRVVARMSQYLSIPWIYVMVFIILTVTEAFPAPGGKNPFFFFFLFFAGYFTSADKCFEVVINKLKFKALLFLFINFPVYLFLALKWAGLPDFAPESILLAFIRNLAIWLTIIVLLGYGKRFLTFGNNWLNYMNRAAFPVYILHQTVLLIIGFLILPFDISIGFKFLLITLLSFISCFGIYELLIRRNSVASWLFGVKAETSINKNSTIGM
ncbi:MAG: acyltransferase family protein [Bacillota bacterium]